MTGEIKYVMIEYVIDNSSGNYIKDVKIFSSFDEAVDTFYNIMKKELQINYILNQVSELENEGYTKKEILDTLFDYEEKMNVGLYEPDFIHTPEFVKLAKNSIMYETRKNVDIMSLIYGIVSTHSKSVIRGEEFTKGVAYLLFEIGVL